MAQRPLTEEEKAEVEANLFRTSGRLFAAAILGTVTARVTPQMVDVSRLRRSQCIRSRLFGLRGSGSPLHSRRRSPTAKIPAASACLGGHLSAPLVLTWNAVAIAVHLCTRAVPNEERGLGARAHLRAMNTTVTLKRFTRHKGNRLCVTRTGPSLQIYPPLLLLLELIPA